MAKKDKPRLSFDETPYRELDRDHLLEHAVSLGGETALEALAYLEELAEVIPFTRKEKEEIRKELEGKRKRKKDKTTGEMIDTDKPLYTKKQIDEMMENKKGTPKHDAFTFRRLYCERYWTEKLPHGKKDDTPFVDKIAAAMAKVKAANKK